MRCKKCNINYPEEFKFCGKCGGELSIEISLENVSEVINDINKRITLVETKIKKLEDGETITRWAGTKRGHLPFSVGVGKLNKGKHRRITNKMEVLICYLKKHKKISRNGIGRLFKTTSGGTIHNIVNLIKDRDDIEIKRSGKYRKEVFYVKGTTPSSIAKEKEKPEIGKRGYSRRRSFYHQFMSDNTKGYIKSGMNQSDAFRTAMVDWSKIRMKRPIEFPRMECISERQQVILEGMLRKITQDNGKITFEESSYALDIYADSWEDFLSEIMVKSDKISGYFGVENKFKIEMVGKYNILKYG